jgi:hypothetical protein
LQLKHQTWHSSLSRLGRSSHQPSSPPIVSFQEFYLR